MKILVPVKRVVDANVKVKVRSRRGSWGKGGEGARDKREYWSIEVCES